MDLKNKKILFELDKNSRASYSQIARATKISQETVRYRVNLLNEQVIQRYLTILNATRLGFSFYQLMLKLQNVDQVKKNNIIDYLKESNKVAWIGDLEGNYDITFILYIRNQLELQEFMDELFNKYNKYIMKKNVSINLNAEFFNRDYLINKERVASKKVSYKSYKEVIELGEIDEKICKALCKDSRINSIELAKEIKVSSDTILQRLKKLRKEGVILGFNIILNQEKINQLHYKILLYLNNSGSEEKLLSSIRLNNRVIAIVKKLAEWDYEVDLEVENVNQLKEFTMSLSNEFSNVIRDYELLRIINMPKYTFYP